MAWYRIVSVFEGFLPRRGAERTRRVEELVSETRTAVLFEAPHRVLRTIEELEASLGPIRRVALARELTKRFEEVWRGSLAEAVEHLRTASPRGEYVIVLDGAVVADLSEDDIARALSRELSQGASTRDAVATVVELTGAKKRQVYDLALRLSNES